MLFEGEGRSTRTAITVGLALALVCTSSILFSIAVGFGIERDTMKVDAATLSIADRLRRAGNIAMAFCVAATLGAGWLMLKTRMGLPMRLHWSVRFLVFWFASLLCTYAGTLLVLYGGVPSLFRSVSGTLSDWILRLTP